MIRERNEYLDILRGFSGDPEGREKAARYVERSDCYVYGRPAPFAFVPAFYTDDDLRFFADLCRVTHDILAKVITHYIECPKYRELFAFPEETERLILLPCSYEEKLPIARFDFFLNEDDHSFRFCEFNADGAAAMSRTQIGCEAVALSDTFQTFAASHHPEPLEMFDSFVEAFLETYESDSRARGEPVVLLTDFTENVTMSDVTRYLASFRKAGITARYVDIRKLGYDARGLFDPDDGMVFNAVYLMAVTSDLDKNIEACHALIRAAEDEKVCLIGHFRTTVAHSKMINVALLDEQTKEILTEVEWNFVRAHILETFRLRGDNPSLDIREVEENRNGWILKPDDDYDSHGVFAGPDFGDTDWKRIVRRYTDRGYIAMRFHVPCRYESALPDPSDCEKEDYGIEAYYSMIGTYSFNGRHHGFFSRMGKEGVISESHNGVSVPSFRVRC